MVAIVAIFGYPPVVPLSCNNIIGCPSPGIWIDPRAPPSDIMSDFLECLILGPDNRYPILFDCGVITYSDDKNLFISF